MNTVHRIALLVGATALFVGCGAEKEALDDIPTHGRGALLITLDTTRADRIGTYGYSGGTTKTIDSLAADGVVFEHALTTAPITLPAHVSILTGVYPAAHGLRDNGIFSLSEKGVVLAEVLRKHGFRTGAFVGSFVLDRRHGLDQGFDVYDGPQRDSTTVNAERPAGDVVDAALRWFDTLDSGEDWFAWIHFYDPHQPWTPPERYGIRHSDPYDAEIAYCDDEIQRLLEHLERKGLDDELTVVVTSDHGEDLNDHGESNHGVFLYQSTMQVPLVISGPLVGSQRGKRFPDAVSLTYLPATLLTLFGIPLHEMPNATPSPLFDATGELAAAGSGPCVLESLLPYYSHRWHPYVGLVAGSHKLIRGKELELYDLASNPEETNNLADSETELLQRLLSQLNALLNKNSDLAWVTDQELANADLEALQALGYTGGSADGNPFDEELPDARDRVEGQKQWGRARVLMMQANALMLPGPHGPPKPEDLERGRLLLQQAETLLAKEIRAYAGDPVVVLAMGQVKQALGDFAAAIPYYERSLTERHDSVTTLYSLAVCLLQTGKTDEGLRFARQAQTLEPSFPHSYLLLSFHDRERKEYGKAAWWLKTLLSHLDPTDITRAQLEHDLGLLEGLMKENGQELEAP